MHSLLNWAWLGFSVGAFLAAIHGVDVALSGSLASCALSTLLVFAKSGARSAWRQGSKTVPWRGRAFWRLNWATAILPTAIAMSVLTGFAYATDALALRQSQADAVLAMSGKGTVLMIGTWAGSIQRNAKHISGEFLVGGVFARSGEHRFQPEVPVWMDVALPKTVAGGSRSEVVARFFPASLQIVPGSWDAVYAYVRRVPAGPFAVTLHRQGILLLTTASLYSMSVVDVGSPFRSVNVLYGSALDDASRSMVASFGKGPAAWILAIAAGDHSMLDAGVVKTLAGLGMVHALIASGATVTMLVVPLVRAMRRFGGSRRGRWYVPALALLAAMALYSGFSLPALRAIAAYAYMWTAEVCGFTYDPWAAFAVSSLALTLWQPDAALDPGVLLSFAAVWVLARMTPALDAVLPGRWPHWVRNVIARGLAAELGLTPLIAALFAQFSLLSLGINLFLYPLLELAIPVCFVLVLLGVFLPQGAATLSPVLMVGADFLNQGIRTLGQGSFVLRVNHVTYTDVLLYYILVWGTYRTVRKYANGVRRRYF